MTKENPSDRITMQEALTQFDCIIADLSASPIASWRMMTSAPHSRAPYPLDARLARAAQHLLRRFKYVLLRLPPIPSGPSSPAPTARMELPDAPQSNPPTAETTGSLNPEVDLGNMPKSPVLPELARVVPVSHEAASASNAGVPPASNDHPASLAPAIHISIPSASLSS